MAKGSRGFFQRERQGAAVLKHGILRRYPAVFASMAGSRSAGGRVVFADLFAGQGTYDDGTEGSPVIAAKTAERLAANRNVVGFYIEENAEAFRRLRRALTEHPAHEAILRRGDAQEHLDEILEVAGSSPLFLLVDPFGLGLDFSSIERVMSRTPPTEVLLNFSFAGLRRNGGHLLSSTTNPPYLKVRRTIVERMDRVLGGDYWQEIWRSEASGERRLELVHDQYLRRIKGAAKTGWFSVPVRDRLEGPVVYVLMLLTRHPEGLWKFHEALSSANDDFYRWCLAGQQTLETDEERIAGWIDEIYGNVARHARLGPFKVRQAITDVFGSRIGIAREMHVRAALKRLSSEGVITTLDPQGRVGGVGNVPDMVVSPV